MKIGRNSFCPCQSGLKYKKCCLIHPERNETAEYLNAQYIDRDYVLSDLKQRSVTMARYLDTVPREIIDLVWIFVNPQLEANMRSMGMNGHLVVIVKQVPIAESDFFDFAHEIGHHLFFMNGYPSGGIKTNNASLTFLATTLLNTIMDPLVNNYVAQHGFDLDEYIKKGFSIQLQEIKDIPHNFIEARHILRCLCIEKILEWRILNIQFENLFLPIFQQYHPDEYKFAVDFVNKIDFSMLTDPQYVRLVLSSLIDENQMQDILSLT